MITTLLLYLTCISREIFHVLDLMKLDMANYRLSILRPQILQQSAKYEREKFKEYLNTNPNGLLSTTQWIRKGRELAEKGHQEATVVDGGSSGHSGASGGSDDHAGTVRLELVNICRHCYLGILLGEGGFPFPEVKIDKAELVELCSVHKVSLV